MLDEKRIIAQIIPKLQRVLIVDPNAMAARLLSDILRDLARSQVMVAPSAAKGLEFAKTFDPQLLFVELTGPDLDGCKFTRALRRSELACREAPVIMVTATATAAGILAARDAGVHEFLRKPFTTKDLVRRLLAVTQVERMWVEAMDYIGPDRRRFNSGDYAGQRKRRSDGRELTDQQRIAQALQILKAAVEAIGRDPAQAMRSMQAQAAELKRAAGAIGDAALATASVEFQHYLATRAGKADDAQELARRATVLLSWTPPEAERAA